MTLYILFKALKEKHISMDTQLYVSDNAAKQPPSRIPLEQGEYISVKQAVKAIIVRSCNSTSVVVAENIAGTVLQFVKLMNKEARKLKLYHTRFANPTGLHHKRQKTTAWDMLKLACALHREFPEYRPYFKCKKFFYKGNIIKTHNKILHICPGSEGMKTGYTKKAGFNLTALCMRYDNTGNPRRIITIVMGEDSAKKRDLKTVSLINRFYNS